MALVAVKIDRQNPDRPAELDYPYLYVGQNNLYSTDEKRIIGHAYKPNPRMMSTPELAELVETLNFRRLGLMEDQINPQYSDPEEWSHYWAILNELLRQMTEALERRTANTDGDAAQNRERSDTANDPERIVINESLNRCFVFGLNPEKLRNVQSRLKQQICEMQEELLPCGELWDYRRRIKECFLEKISEVLDRRRSGK